MSKQRTGEDSPDELAEFIRSGELAEFVRNGDFIDWLEYARESLKPMHAAQLAHAIDPWRHVDKNGHPDPTKYAQGPVPATLLASIRRLAQRLDDKAKRWTLAELAAYLGDKAPAGMREAVEVRKPASLAEPEIAAASAPLAAASVQCGIERWRVLPMARGDDLRGALHAFLSVADKTREPPSAREVLSAWMAAKPLGIVRVMTDGVDCLAKNGTEERTFGIDAIADRIARLVQRLPGQ